MKVLMTSSGGIIRNIEGWPEYTLASTLVELGHDVTVLSSSSVISKHDAHKKEIIDGIKAVRFNPILPGSFFHMLKDEWDIIHMHHLGYLAPISSYGALANKIKKMPSVFTVHGIYHDPYLVKDVEDPFLHDVRKNIQYNFPFTRPWRAGNWFVHLPLKNADKITALTNWEKNQLTKFRIKEESIDVVPNGINIEKYKNRNTKNYFKSKGIDGSVMLFVGQPSRRKGWEYFIRAIPGIVEKNEDAKAVFVGYRSNKELESLCQELGIADNVRFLGFLKEEEKIAAFKSADVFVQPTLYEGFGIVFLEAMASGLPIVTTDVAGNKEIVKNGENGLLVRPRDSDAIGKAAVKMLESKALRSKMRSKNIRKANDYDKRKITKKMMNVYESVIR